MKRKRTKKQKFFERWYPSKKKKRKTFDKIFNFLFAHFFEDAPSHKPSTN